MQRKTNKKIFSKLIIVLVICSAVIFTALHVRINDYNEENSLPGSSDVTGSPSETEEQVAPEATIDDDYTKVPFNLGNFLYKDIYINGYHINNWQIKDPFISIDGEIYVPMSDGILKALGLSVSFTDEKHEIKIRSSNNPSLSAVYDDMCACNLQYREVYWGHTYFINGDAALPYSAVTTKEDEENPKRVLYMSLTALEKYSGADFSYYYDDVSGIYISTLAQAPAKSFFSENNKLYISGRAHYMMYINPNLDEETAYSYEYLFRHEAENSLYLDQDTLMGICQTESRFVHVAQSNVDAIGLMQVMYVYAERYGYTVRQLQEPHYNIQFGRTWFDMFCEECGGDVIMGLTSYYMGVGGMYDHWNATGSYHSDYSDTCIGNRNMLQSWVAENGYSNSFEEYTGK